MVLLIDLNYDSFSYNLVQLFGKLTDGKVKVVRNDEYKIDGLEVKSYTYYLSPGPGKHGKCRYCERGNDARKAKGRISNFRSLLGHQSICEVFGAQVTYAKQLMHLGNKVTYNDAE